ncbi:MAG: DUF1579 domain-containing protein [Planctomycetaceae bacterium]|nr:DUF1579 domain-containing protein [Planctomycetaceae bacterium]
MLARPCVLLFVVGCLRAASISFAQDIPELPQPQKEHAWLERFVGEWTSTAEAKMGPGEPKFESTGTQKARMLGGFWMISEGEAAMMDVTIHSILTVGYDPAKKQYIGTWTDSCNDHLWHYTGKVSEDGRTLTLDARGPNFAAPGTSANYRETIEFQNDDHYTFSSSVELEEGKWFTFMTAQYHRKPSAAEK